VLGQCLSETDTPIPERLIEFQRRRKPRTDNLAFESRSRSVASTETDPERFAKLQAAVRAGDPHTVLNGMLEIVSGGPIA
jgi:c-di-GMP-binding flagellar brake protein YcgR